MSALGTDGDSCVKLVVTAPPAVRSHSIHGACASSRLLHHVFYVHCIANWTSPSGRTYMLDFGDAQTAGAGVVPGEAASVVAKVWQLGRSGPVRHLASVQVVDGWFAIGFAVPRGDGFSVVAMTSSGRDLVDLDSDDGSGKRAPLVTSG